MVNQIILKSIKCSGGPFKKDFLWTQTKNKVNVFYGYNGAGKTLIFTSIHHMLIGENTSEDISENIQDFSIEITAEINNKIVFYQKNILALTIQVDGKNISLSDYKMFLSEELGLDQKLLGFARGKIVKKNTIPSILRYNFISDNDLYRKSKGYQDRIPLINTHYDYSCKMPLLAYFLGIDFTEERFKDCCDLCIGEDYIGKHKNEYAQLKIDKTIFDDINKENELYSDYISKKRRLSSLKYAMKQLSDLIELANKTTEVPNIAEDISFLEGQKAIFNKLIKSTESEKDEIKKRIETMNSFGKDSMLKHEENTSKVGFIKQYDEHVSEVKRLTKKLNKLLSDYKIIFIKLVDFISNSFKEIKYYGGYFPILDEKTLELVMNHPVSEGQIIGIRILGIIMLNLFSTNNSGRIPNILLFDSISEKICEKGGINGIYNSVNYLVNKNKNIFPQTFLFISGDKGNDRFNFDSLNNFEVFDLNNY